MAKIEKGVSVAPTTQTTENQLLILRPSGEQGPKVGLGIADKAAYQRLDEAMGQLSVKERKTVEGIMRAATLAGVPIVDS